MAHRCWTDRALSPMLRKVLTRHGATFPPSSPYTLYLPRTSGPFAATSRQHDVPPGAFFGALPGCGTLTGKRAVWVRLVQKYGLQTAQRISPPTWLLDSDRDRARLQASFRPGLYVLKARREHRKGLRLSSDLDEILAVRQDIVQRVLTDTLGIEGRRVQLRLYLLLTQHAGTLTAQVYENGRCLYGAASGDPFDVYLATKQVHPDEGLPTTLRALIADPRIPVSTSLLPALRRLLGKVIAATAEPMAEIRHLDHARCFQLIGVDVVLRPNGRPVFIEANKGPSMVPTSRDDERFKRRLLRRMLATAGVTPGAAEGFLPLTLPSGRPSPSPEVPDAGAASPSAPGPDPAPASGRGPRRGA